MMSLASHEEIGHVGRVGRYEDPGEDVARVGLVEFGEDVTRTLRGNCCREISSQTCSSAWLIVF